jgi:hypothetical protein
VLDNCFKCGNCNGEGSTYYCPFKNEIIIVENTQVIEKTRNGWKKGSKEYENHRRKTRTELSEAQ